MDKLEAARKFYEGQAAEAEATINVYTTNSVGIGEHSDILGEINKWVGRLAEAEDSLLALERYKDK